MQSEMYLCLSFLFALRQSFPRVNPLLSVVNTDPHLCVCIESNQLLPVEARGQVSFTYICWILVV